MRPPLLRLNCTLAEGTSAAHCIAIDVSAIRCEHVQCGADCWSVTLTDEVYVVDDVSSPLQPIHERRLRKRRLLSLYAAASHCPGRPSEPAC